MEHYIESSKACCFTGHRIISKADRETVISSLRSEIQNLISHGISDFICGGALGFDTLAAQAVLDIRNIEPSIRLNLIIPCKTQSEKWRKSDKEIYDGLISAADYVEYISDEYTSACMHIRNRRMVELSQYCICYLRRQGSGTASTVRYAEEKNRTVIRI